MHTLQSSMLGSRVLPKGHRTPSRAQRTGAVVVHAKYQVSNDVTLGLESLSASRSAAEANPAPVQAAASPLADTPSPITLDKISGAAGDAAAAASAATKAAAADAAAAASALASGAKGLVSDLSGSVSGLTSSVSGLKDSLTGSVSGLTGGLTSSVSGLTGSVSELKGSLSSSVSDLTGSASQAAASVGSSVREALGAAGATAGEVTSGVTSTLSSTTQAVSQAVGEAAAAVTATTSAVTSAVGGAVTAAEASLSATTAAVWGAVPEPAQGALVQVGGALGTGAGFVAAHPGESLVVSTAVAVPLLVRAYKARFGGYAGDLSPGEVYSLLEGEAPALLLDVRPDAVRAKEGVAELKLGARFKAVALPLSVAQAQVNAIQPLSAARAIADRERLVLTVHATFVAGLQQVTTPLANVVVMDGAGSEGARAIARTLRAEGLYSSYVMAGGFTAWAKAGLPVTTKRGADYEASATDFLSDNLEVLGEKAKDLGKRFSDPKVALPVLSTTTLGAVALYNYHTTLQLIGLLGVTATVTLESIKYGSLPAAVAAWRAKLPALPAPKPKAAAAATSAKAAVGAVPGLKQKGGAPTVAQRAAKPAVPVPAAVPAAAGDGAVSKPAGAVAADNSKPAAPAATAVAADADATKAAAPKQPAPAPPAAVSDAAGTGNSSSSQGPATPPAVKPATPQPPASAPEPQRASSAPTSS